MSNLLIKLDLFFKKCFYQSIKHYRLIIFITISFFFFCLYQCLNLKQVSSIEDQLDPSMQSTKDIIEERKLFGSNNVIGFFIPVIYLIM